MNWHAEQSVSVGVAAVLLVAVTSCTSNNGSPANGGPTSGEPATSTTDATPQSDSEKASETATDHVRTYFATVDLVRQDPKRPESDLDAVASSTELLAQKNLLKSQREGALHQVGETKIVEINVESISLDNPVTALVDVCWDVGAVDILDRSGKSVVAPERKDIGWTRLTVTNGSWETAPTNGWRVSGGSDLEREPCAGS